MALVGLVKAKKKVLELDYETLDENLIDNTGTVDVTAQLQALFDRLYSEGKRVVQNSGTYYVNGTLSMKLLADSNLKGCTFLPGPNFKGNLYISQSAPLENYDASSSVVAKINGSSALSRRASSGQLDGLYNDTTLDGKYVIIDSTQEMYWSRGSIKTWRHRAVIYNRGLMSNTLRYALPAGTCNRVQALPIRLEKTYVWLPNWDMRNTPHNINIIIENCTRAEIVAGGVYNRPLQDTGNEYLIKMQNCYNVHIKGLKDRSNLAVVGGNSTSTYALVVNNCLGCVVEDMDANGIGWGSQEGESCTDTTFIRCNLSRYDFHSPFDGFTKLIDCQIGNHGVMMCGTGLLILERPHWVLETLQTPAVEVKEIALIKTRDDYGGWFDGDLVVVDAKVSGGFTAKEQAGADIYLIAGNITMANTNPAGDILPPTSPIKPTLFNNVHIRGMKFERWLDGARFTQMLYSNLSGVLYHPNVVKIEDMDYNCGGNMVFRHNTWKTTGFDAAKTANPFYTPFTHHIELNGVQAAGFAFISDVAALNPHVLMRNVKNLHGEHPRLQLHQRGSYELESCHVSGFDFSYNGTNNLSRPLGLKMLGGSIKTPVGSVPITAPVDLTHSIVFDSVDIVGDYSHTEVKAANTALAAWARCKNCNYYRIGDGAMIPHLLLWDGVASTTPTTVELYIASGSDIWTNSIFGSIETMDTFPMPRLAGTYGRQLYNSSGVAGYALSGVMRQNRFLVQSIYASSSLRKIALM